MHIGIAGWSLHRSFQDRETPLLLLDYPQLAHDEWGFTGIELNNIFMASHDESYLEQLKQRAQDAGVELWGMAVDGTGSLCEEDTSTREKNIRDCVAYLEIGKYLGLSYMRFNTGGDVEPDEAQIERCADSFATLAREGEARGVAVCIENHGGLSRMPDPIVAVMQRVDSPWCRTLPDWGNFADDIRYEAIEKVVPYAIACHAKFWNFDERGRDPRIDVDRIKEICGRVGFNGCLALEWEGPGESFANIPIAKELLTRTFA